MDFGFGKKSLDYLVKEAIMCGFVGVALAGFISSSAFNPILRVACVFILVVALLLGLADMIFGAIL